jgi:hypothetical protein
VSPFVGPAYTLSLPLRKAAIDDAINCYIVGMETPGKAPFVQPAVDGYTEFADLGAEIRGTLTTNDRTYFVAGSGLYELTALGASALRGTLLTSTGPVSMAFGVSQLVIVDGDNGYVMDHATSTFTQITGDGWHGSNTVSFLDNYFLFVRPDSGQFYISDIDNAASLDALEFATAESQPDNLAAILPVQRRGILMGDRSIEIWFDSGAAEFPFEREGTTIEVGCIAAHAAKVLDNTAFWIGQDRNGGGIVYRLNGYQAVRISTQGVEQALQASPDLSQATAYCYQKNGLTFYAINAPGLTATWVYEVSSGAWHKRCDLDALGNDCADRGVCHTYAFGEHLLGASDGKVYVLDADVHTKAGDPIRVRRVSPHSATPSLKWIRFDAFHADLLTGEAPQGVDPQVSLEYSEDSGATWSDPDFRSLGRVGERFARITWRRLGQGRDRVWRMTTDSNVPFAIVNVSIEAKELQ